MPTTASALKTLAVPALVVAPLCLLGVCLYATLGLGAPCLAGLTALGGTIAWVWALAEL